MSASITTLSAQPTTPTSDRSVGLVRASLLQKLGGYMNSQLIYVLAKLGVADHLTAGPQPSTTLAHELGVAHDILFRILRGCVSAGLLIETSPGQFAATPLTQMLESHRPDSLRGYALLSGEVWYAAWGALWQALETGRTPFESTFGTDYYSYLAQNPAANRSFQVYMQARTQQSGQALSAIYNFSAVRTVVDIGGGNGTLLQILLHDHPHLNGVLYDLPEVIAEAAKNPALQQLGTRCQLVSGDFTQQVPAGGDCYILSQILHSCNDEECLRILHNCFVALPPQGRLLILEQVIPAQLQGNMPAVEMDLMMLVLLHGRERTADAYATLLATAGFSVTAVQPLKTFGYSLIESQKNSEQ
jgi:hypothetical protein